MVSAFHPSSLKFHPSSAPPPLSPIPDALLIPVPRKANSIQTEINSAHSGAWHCVSKKSGFLALGRSKARIRRKADIIVISPSA